MASAVDVDSEVSAASASEVLERMVFDSASTRDCSVSAAAVARLSSSLETAEVRSTRSSSMRLMRPSSVSRDLERAGAEGLVHLTDLGADGVGDFGAAGVDGSGDVADALVERGDDLVAAVVERVGEIGDAHAEQVFELDEALVERGGEGVGAAGDAVVERVEIGAHGRGDVVGTLAEPLNQFAAVGLHGVVEFGDVARDQAAQCGGIARDLFGQRSAVMIEHLLRRP
jgi:hypothetical protein